MIRDYPKEFSPEIEAATTAAIRFGYGLRPHDLDRIAADGALDWLIKQLKPQSSLPPALLDLPTTNDRLQESFAIKGTDQPTLRKFKKKVISQARTETATLALVTLDSMDPFRERLIRFWTNHFTVSIRTPHTLGLVTAFEREAIRPYMDGSFSQMLLAVAKHPAMLAYLDNVSSVGPRSPVGRLNNLSYNEDYARALLELHTVGPGTHYTQKDIIELAKILTGWTLRRKKDGKLGQFVYKEQWHEPGGKIVMGKIFPQAGVLEGESLFDFLANQPKTARHLATKMATYFVSDDPSEELIDNMVQEFNKNKGHVMALASGMINSSEAWKPQAEKIKTPEDLVFSTMRALNIQSKNGRNIIRALELLGQPPFAAPTPAGWPDKASSWVNPDSLLERLEWSANMAQRSQVNMIPTNLALNILGSRLSRRTYNHMTIAANPHEAISLMLTSPEFQRR